MNKQIAQDFMETREQEFSGISNANGAVHGNLVWHSSISETPSPIGEPLEEWQFLQQAMENAIQQLEKLCLKVDEETSSLLEFQMAILNDHELRTSLKKEILKISSSEEAWKKLLNDLIHQYRELEDSYFRDRYEDFLDIRNRVLGILRGHQDNRNYEVSSIYIGEDLLLSQFLEMDLEKVKGIVLLNGNLTGHVGILAQAKGIPHLVKLKASASDLQEKCFGILDTDNAVLFKNPSNITISKYDSWAKEENEKKRIDQKTGKRRMQSVVDELAMKIAGGEYPEGHQLPVEKNLADTFGTGRNILREAIKFLSAKGLLTTGPRIGTYVLPQGEWSILDSQVLKWVIASKKDDPKFMDELNEFRMILEPLVSKQSALGADHHQKQEILNKLHDLETSEGIPNKGMQADIEFHCSIYESTNNMLLANLKHFVKALIKENHRILGGESPSHVRVHRKIAEAIVNQKASDAFDATTELLRLNKNDQTRIKKIQSKYL
ncbi:MAG: GntR family transcriptional regulator [SAR324 cluster bacterium]|nr:GntR family transcriptional regulator [SAR324 cluster bacterium]MDP7334429.1 GntR family transcriptional regulator [SAR324 cluster bacterium]